MLLRDGLDTQVAGIIKIKERFPVAQLVGEIESGAVRYGKANAERGFLDATARFAKAKWAALVGRT